MTDLFAETRSKNIRIDLPSLPDALRREDHRCAVCGAWAGFGFGVSARFDRQGRWSCFQHRDQVDRMAG